MDNNRVGDLTEHKAVVWLLKQGLEVFRNECCSGPIDIITYNIETQEILKIDVKTAVSYIMEDGTRTIHCAKQTDIQKELNIKILRYDKEKDTFTFLD